MRRLALTAALLLSGCYATAGGFITKPAKFRRGDYEPAGTYICVTALSVTRLETRLGEDDRYEFQCMPYREFLSDAFNATKGRGVAASE